MEARRRGEGLRRIRERLDAGFQLDATRKGRRHRDIGEGLGGQGFETPQTRHLEQRRGEIERHFGIAAARTRVRREFAGGREGAPPGVVEAEELKVIGARPHPQEPEGIARAGMAHLMGEGRGEFLRFERCDDIRGGVDRRLEITAHAQGQVRALHLDHFERHLHARDMPSAAAPEEQTIARLHEHARPAIEALQDGQKGQAGEGEERNRRGLARLDRLETPPGRKDDEERQRHRGEDGREPHPQYGGRAARRREGAKAAEKKGGEGREGQVERGQQEAKHHAQEGEAVERHPLSPDFRDWRSARFFSRIRRSRESSHSGSCDSIASTSAASASSRVPVPASMSETAVFRA